MKKLFFFLIAALPVMAQKAAPDLIVHNASVHTLDDALPVAQAVAVSGGRIIKVGTTAEVFTLKNKKTKVIDAQGKTLVPGIFDSHLHVIRGGRFYNAELRWDGVRSLKRALQMLREQAQRTPAGQWVRVVGGWNAYQFEEKRLPTLQEINEATGQVPAFVLHLYGHAYLNRAGLKALNITADTPSPKGALIQKDENGEPTGLLVAEPNAFLLYSTLAKLPELSQEEKLNSTRLYMAELNRLGITSIMDAGGGFQNYPDDYGITDLLNKRNELTVRLPFYLFAQKAGTELSDYTKWITEVEIGGYCEASAERKAVKNFGKWGSVEYFVQGGGENLVATAADFENFDQPRPDLPPAMEAQLKAVISTLVKNRWPFRLHATYDESITRFLNVIEEVNVETPLNGLLWFFDHAETISAANLQRVKKLGGSIAIQHRMAYQGESFIKRYGKKAAEFTPPVKQMIDMGITVGMGSDGTRVSSYNPWIGLYWLTTGKTVGGLKHMADANLLDRETALALFTKGSAKLVNLHHDRGMIKEGHLADFILLSEDYFTVDAEKIPGITSLLTVLGGKIVYGDGGFKAHAPALPRALPGWSPVNFYGGYQNR
ncbi:amidohydrolase [Flavobacterium cyanobacteriorum]|uniref:Amidohydrolase n=1 Tax=Flavobacterium cyanobacteriorum TaxID=2022802 RepID=A0A255YUH8_9FLAO|nr:amidohydrolase [Flavobacterium cyanobacteriorum]OYQ32080.1 amidohydrolase [Flavobacterium cyanobacteriorum]